MTDCALRVLHVLGSLDRGGAESMIMNLYRKIDRQVVQFDFVVNQSNLPYAYENEINDLGGRIFYLPVLSFKNTFHYMRTWKFLLAQHPEWRVVHVHHTSSATISIPIAKRLGRITIAHSHTAGSDGSVKSNLKIATRFPIRYLADHLFACSISAGKWMFGNQAKRSHVLNNAINTVDFFPDSHEREAVRAAVGIGSGRKVIGHVGRFIDVKNHVFMLDVLNAMVEQDSSALMMLIGDGQNKELIMSKAESLGLADHILFMGIRPNIASLMQAMDAFIFPSLHEGLPVTLVEAQASGLPCLVSTAVCNEVKLSDCIEFMSLDTAASVWAKKLLEMASTGERLDTRQQLIDAGYDVNDNAQWLQLFYLDLMESV